MKTSEFIKRGGRMRYKEFKEEIEDWGRKHRYATEVTIEDSHTFVKVGVHEASYIVAHISTRYTFVLGTNWHYVMKIEEHARGELLDILVELAKTPPEDRKDEKRFIIPLPGLATSDGKQQYLSYKDGFYFASRIDETLVQTWKEEHLKFVPEIYRQFAVEFDEGKEH